MRALGENENHREPIIIVSGLPRSGTSLMMKMLEAGGIAPLSDHERTADDDNPQGYYEFERVKKLTKGDTAWLPEARGKAVKIIAMLLLHLPEGHPYRIVFMRRRMPEILASQKKMLVRRGEDPDRLPDEDMDGFFTNHLRKVEAFLESRRDIGFIDIWYNELLSDPAPQIERIEAFLGGGLDTEKMIRTINPDLYRNRSSRAPDAASPV